MSKGGILCRVNQVWELQAPRGEGFTNLPTCTAALSIAAASQSGGNARLTSKNSFSAAAPLCIHEKRTSSITQRQQCRLPPGQYCGRRFLLECHQSTTHKHSWQEISINLKLYFLSALKWVREWALGSRTLAPRAHSSWRPNRIRFAFQIKLAVSFVDFALKDGTKTPGQVCNSILLSASPAIWFYFAWASVR